MLRCKMKVEEVLHIEAEQGSPSQERVKLRAVSGPGNENEQWSRWMPSARFEISISNPDVIGKLFSGHEYFVDVAPCGIWRSC